MDDDRAVEAFTKLVSGISGKKVVPAVDYLALYRAKVVAQSADFAYVDLQPDDDRIPGVANVPITLGLPGCTAQVSAGAYMLLGWRDGNPTKPYAMPSWESGASVTKVVVTATTVYLGAESGSEFVARTNDAIGVGTWTHVPAAGVGVTPCSLSYTPPGGMPTPIVAPGVAVTGKITGGATQTKAK